MKKTITAVGLITCLLAMHVPASGQRGRRRGQSNQPARGSLKDRFNKAAGQRTTGVNKKRGGTSSGDKSGASGRSLKPAGPRFETKPKPNKPKGPSGPRL